MAAGIHMLRARMESVIRKHHIVAALLIRKEFMVVQRILKGVITHKACMSRLNLLHARSAAK